MKLSTRSCNHKSLVLRCGQEQIPCSGHAGYMKLSPKYCNHRSLVLRYGQEQIPCSGHAGYYGIVGDIFEMVPALTKK